MKKVISLLAMAIMIVGLSGCIDDPDNSGEKMPAKQIITNVHL